MADRIKNKQEKTDGGRQSAERASMAQQLHGGDRYRNQIKLDFSVSTNPLGVPAYIKEALQDAIGAADNRDGDICQWYPDPACERLRETLAAHHQVSKEQILCGNGASELLMAIVRAAAQSYGKCDPDTGALRKKPVLRAVLPVPSFGEYERTLQAAGAEICYYEMEEKAGFSLTASILDVLTPDVGLLFLCNPNNPTGSRIPEELLHRILAHCKNREILVVLDECFMELSVTGEGKKQRLYELTVCYPYLILVKAFTKLYAMAGLRLGYCISSSERLLYGIKTQLPCWNVSGIAQLAGLTALDNEKNIDYISQTRSVIEEERRYLELQLERLGMRLLPGSANFICFYNGAAKEKMQTDLYSALLQRGILIRDCSSFRGMSRGWYRIAVRGHEENQYLIRQLEALLRS